MRRARLAWLLFLSPILMVALTGRSRAEADDTEVAPRPNVLLIVSDDQRLDTLGILGRKPIRTPNLDQLARQGVMLTRAVCANPICTPSRAEILTGCSGFTNGVLDFGRQIDPKLTNWPTAMQQAGYRTWYVGKWHNDGKPVQRGYDATRGLFAGGGGKWWEPQKDFHGVEVTGYRGWIFQGDDGKKFPEKGVGLTPDISSKFADAAIEVLKTPHQQPFFLHVNFTAPHDPLLMPPGYEQAYDAAKMPVPENFAERHPFDHGNFEGRDEKLLPWPRTRQRVQADLAVYYSVISHMDQQIGRILQALRENGQEQNTIVVFCSDHGLAMGSHGLRGKQNMYEHTINVPFVIRAPGLPRGKRLAAQAYLRDLYPTVCALAGVKAPRSLEGRSLVKLLDGTRDSIYPHVFCYFRDSQRMVRTDHWKLIHYPKIDRYQLYDLANDPLEQDDLAGRPQQRLRQLQLTKLLRAEQEQVDDPVLKQASTP